LLLVFSGDALPGAPRRKKEGPGELREVNRASVWPHHLLGKYDLPVLTGGTVWLRGVKGLAIDDGLQ
jgi:hypothetical protein